MIDKEELITLVKEIDSECDRLLKGFQRDNTQVITKLQTRQSVEIVAKKWFEDVEPFTEQFGIIEPIRLKYHEFFTQLLNLSLKPSKNTTYQKILRAVLEELKEDYLIPIIKSADKITSIANLTSILVNVTPDERAYLIEALGCAQRGFLRASMVLVWSAAVSRLQKKIELLGVTNFNAKSEEMKAINEGRFKRFKKSFSIHSLSELRATVFDTDLLWVLEYWDLIDVNQHNRLEICFIMRNSAAHPGEAVVTEPNLASAFSDLKTIVFDNPKFKL